MALIGGPVAFFGLLELVLRLCGYGYPTQFLLHSSNQGQATLIQNNRFGWRFFGARMSRVPYPISVPREKPTSTVRIFVLGESAAFGDPQPQFGLSRLLEAMLELRHPGVKFEVVNAAMTAINSHAILPIARDCAQAGGDVWVLYLGNNEVVGPFGAGTVFGPRAPPRSLVRASLAVKTTCTGQLLDSLLDSVGSKPTSDKGEWEGMKMFLQQTVRATDPAMERVYRNFQGNLADIIRASRASGAGVVVSTVAVNLRDCAPFASLHRPDLKEPQLADWRSYFESGIQAQQATNWAKAAELFRAAARQDDTFAELRFRMGQCALALGQAEEARTQFTAARDLDSLRFRCDSRLNDLIRETARAQEPGILLADGERAMADASPDRLPGTESFYDHVHLTFDGNHALARTICEQVEKLLPKTVPPASRPWPEVAVCARRLGRTDRALQLGVSGMLGRVNDAPFTAQANHADHLSRLAALAQGLAPSDAPAIVREAGTFCEYAIREWPDDALLYQQLADIKLVEKDCPGALAAAKRSLDLLPTNLDSWMLLGLALAGEGKYADAADAFRHVFEEYPEAMLGINELAFCNEQLGRRDEAIKVREQMLRLAKAKFGPDHPDTLRAMNNLASAYDAAGQREKALKLREQTLQRMQVALGPEHPDTLRVMANLANSYRTQGRLAEARDKFAEVLATQQRTLGKLNPTTINTANNLAWLLATCANPTVRNGESALRLAQEAAAATSRTNAVVLDTLAAAYAETGDFAKAVAAQREAIAVSGNETNRDYESRLRLYQSGAPYRPAEKMSP
jgi:tetratricopeptide (TPR) repeat protein